MGTCQSIEGLLDAREQKGILPGLTVQLSIITTETETAILLLHQYDRRCIGTATAGPSALPTTD